MTKSHLKLVTPAPVNRTVAPTRLPNAKLRTREFLTEAGVERLMAAAKRNRWGHRDATMILVAYRHGLRASELADLRWARVEFDTAALHVRRVKQGTPSAHPILGDELRALRQLQRKQEPKAGPRVYIRTGSALQHRWIRAHGGARRQGSETSLQGPPPYAAPRLRIYAGEQGA